MTTPLVIPAEQLVRVDWNAVGTALVAIIAALAAAAVSIIVALSRAKAAVTTARAEATSAQAAVIKQLRTQAAKTAEISDAVNGASALARAKMERLESQLDEVRGELASVQRERTEDAVLRAARAETPTVREG